MNQQVDSNEDENKKDENKREGFRVAFRRRLFQIFFEIMRERNIDQIFASVMMLVNFLQIYGELYNTKTNFPFRDDIFTTISQICDIARIFPLIEQQDSPIYYWILAYGAIFVMICFYILIVYIDFSIKIEKFYFVFPIKLIRFFSSLIFWILIMPFVQVFVSIFSCSNGYHTVVTDLQCWSGIHIFYCILFMLSLLGYFIIFILISFFYNESRPYHTDAFARLDTNFETYLTLYKILITVVGHFLFSSTMHWLIIAIHIIGSFSFCKMYLKYIPYYNSLTSVLFGSGIFCYFWISLNVLLTKALETVNYQGQSIVIIVGIILIFPAAYQIREYKIQNKIFNKKHDKIKSEFELDIFIHKIYRLIIDQHVNEVDEMVLLGIVHNHQSECLNNECPLNNNDELYLPLTDSVSDRKSMFSKDPILLYHLINSIYAEYAKSSNSTAVLHSTYAYFLFYQIGNIHSALLELYVAEKQDTNSQQKFTIYRAKRFIENYLEAKYGKNKDASMQTFADLDVTIVITFEGLFAKLNKEIEKSANDHIEFWSHLDSQMVDLNVLHKLGLNIINNTKKINEIWHQLLRINSLYPKALQMYGNYLVQIKNDNVEGEEFIVQANTLARPKSLDEHVNDFEMMFADDTAIVVISGNKDQQAKIMKTNNGITKLFQYNTFEVHGHEVNILMPPIIGVKHYYFLEHYFKTAKETVLNRDFSTFAMLRAGHIFAVSLIIKPVPSLKNDIQYIGLIKPINKDYDFILTDQFGRIDSISLGITKMLMLQASFFKENEIFIQVLCPLLCEVERKKGTKDFETKFDLWQGVKDLVFIIPRNFSNMSQKSGGRSNMNASVNQSVNILADDDENRRGDQNFVGLKSPDHLKKVCNMFRNGDFKTQPQKYIQTLKNNINYDNPELYKGPIKCEIINRSHGNGYLQLKVFKILNNKRAGGTGDSDDELEINKNSGNKNVKALIDETMKNLGQISAVELQIKIQQMKTTVDQIKKGIRHPSAKAKPSNITTPGQYESAEIRKYNRDIQVLQEHLDKLIKQEERKTRDQGSDKELPFFQGMLSQGSAPENLLQDDANIDVEQIKKKYPLRENEGANPDDSPNEAVRIPLMDRNANVNVGDISAGIYDENPNDQSKNATKNEENSDFEDEPNFQKKEKKQRFENMDEGGLDILKDIRKKQSEIKKKKVQKEDVKQGEEVKEGEEGVPAKETADGATTGGPTEEEEEKFMDEDTGSVASSSKDLMKHLRMLRNALYENYSPPAIRNLKFYAKIAFLLLLLITIAWYVYAKSIYSVLRQNIENIHSSKNRLISLTEIGADVRILSYLTKGQIPQNRGGQNYEQFKRNQLLDSSITLQQAQNNLSLTNLINYFSDDSKELINPSEITVIYNVPSSLQTFQQLDSWSTMVDVSIQAFMIQQLPLKNITLDNNSVFFIITNAFNSILESIQKSTTAIQNEHLNISSSQQFILRILLYVASGSLFLSICLILPVATQVDQNKDALLRNFMLIDREDVKMQLDKCRIFFSSMHDKEHITQQNMGDIDDEEQKDEEGKEGEDGDPANPNKKKGTKRSRKNKMHKKFSTNFISLIVKFLVVLTVLEGYFILCYLQAQSFLGVANNLIGESGAITQREFSNNFLYQMMQEVLITNGQAQVLNINSLRYIFDYLNTTINEQEAFLKTHSNNAGDQTADYNTFFDNLIYQNLCDAIYADPTLPIYKNCTIFMGGILEKGLYSANVAYWDNMRSMATDFNNSARNNQAINNILNSDRMVQNEQLKDVYFSISYEALISQLDLSIFTSFDNRNKNDTILFAVYIVILFLLYFVLWRKFIEATRHSLWVTKSMLAIIPLEIIEKVPKIKDFLLASSKTTLSALKE